MATGQLEPIIRHLRQAAGADAPLSDGQLLARFVRLRDEGAFASLVGRHGPMVLGLCRRVLGDRHAAEDAFQATFLLLARKAPSLAGPDLLGPWLHRVAWRTAARARALAVRRRTHEARAKPAPPVSPDDGVLWRDTRPVLDEEINRLPDRYRVPVTLCYLEGRTNAEAARRLGCSRGTVATLLARARQRLRRRLTGRGLAPPAALTAASLAASAGAAAVPAVLKTCTVEAVALFSAGGWQAATAPAAVLAKGVATDMLMKKVTVVAVCSLLACVALAGAGLVARDATVDQPASPRPPRAARAEAHTATAPPATPPASPGTFRTANFEVQAPSGAVARKVARAAEAHRKKLALAWLGKEMPTWTNRCGVKVALHEGGTGGSTSFAFDRGMVLSQDMRLEGTVEQILDDLLPHEVTHTVWAHAFGAPVPRWADEGAALLAEGAASRARHERMLWTVLEQGRGMSLRLLLPLREYPRDVMVLYAQGHSLSDFLVRKGGRATFLAFVKQGEKEGWKQAAKAHYGHATVDDLEKAWLASVNQARKAAGREAPIDLPPVRAGSPLPARPVVKGKDDPAPPEAPRVPRGRLPAGPAPVQALVELTPEGDLRVWRPQTVYRPVTVKRHDGQPVTSYVLDATEQEQTYRFKEVQVFDVRGKVIAAAAVRKRLKEETPALVAADGRPVDPLHLRLIKVGTLIFVPPAAVPAPPAVPPTSRER